MNKKEYMIAALKSGLYTKKSWVISAFSVAIQPDTDFPLALIRNDEGVYFQPAGDKPITEDTVAGDLKSGLVQLMGVGPTEAAYRFDEPVTITNEDCPNVEGTIETTYGNLFVNYLVLVYPFGDRIPFITGVVNPKKIESQIEELLVSNPERGETAPEGKITVEEYLTYTDAICTLGGYTQLCVPSATPRTLVPPPGIKELRAKLLAENADRLHDPAVIAKIDKALVDYDKAWLAEDKDAMGFYMKDKSFNVVRKKQYLFHGAESGFSDTGEVDVVVNSLDDGWDITKLPAMINSLREGSFNRGALTALGGEAVKYFYRVMQNARIIEPDCGTTAGVMRKVLPAYVGFSVLSSNKTIKLTDDNIGKYLGKTMLVRSPSYCETAGVNYCETCMGEINSRNPTGLGAAAAEVGSTFLGTFMSMMHGNALVTEELVLEDLFS